MADSSKSAVEFGLVRLCSVTDLTILKLTDTEASFSDLRIDLDMKIYSVNKVCTIIDKRRLLI